MGKKQNNFCIGVALDKLNKLFLSNYILIELN